MTPKELIPAEEYAKIKQADMAKAQSVYDFYQTCDDPLLADRENRPITDMKHMLETSVQLWGDSPAFHEKPSHSEPYKVYTYKDTKADVDAVGTALHSRGFRGERIGVIGDNSYNWCVAYLAAVCGVGIAVPLDNQLLDAEIEHLAEDSEIKVIFYSKKYADKFLSIKNKPENQLELLVNVDAELSDIKPGEISLSELKEEGNALLVDGNRSFLDAQVLRQGMGVLLYTSGTTGVAKGVMLSQENLCTDLMISPTVFTVRTDDMFFLILPLHHTYACTCSFLIPLYKGASIAMCEGLKYITDNLQEVHPTMILGVPLIFENFYRKIWQSAKKSGKDKLLRKVISVNHVTKKIGLDISKIFLKDVINTFGGKLTRIICGGAAINPDILKGLGEFGLGSLQGYGLTECAPICALNPEKAPRPDSAGYLIPGFDGKIVDGEPDPETGHIIGEICVKGDNVMIGYYKNEEATREVLVDGWYHTGDLGYIDETRFVYITGRKKNVIITKTGENVYPEELEYLLGNSDIVSESMVWQSEADLSDDSLIVATIRVDAEATTEALGSGYADEDVEKLLWAEVDKINDILPYYKKIKKIVLRKEPFDITTSQKIKRFVAENKEGVHA
jgi:long-subunit acyl-CoA synthetase (AMP-forming)